MSFKTWEKKHLKAFDNTLFMVLNPESNCYEIWRRRTNAFEEPNSYKQLQYWLDNARWGYLRVMELRGKRGEPADPGPWVLEILHEYDTERDPNCTKKYWAKQAEWNEREKAKADEVLKDEIKYHARGMRRDLEGKTPHGGLIGVPATAPVGK